MPHPLILGLFDDAAAAAQAARALRELGLPHERVSIVARSHDEEVNLARETGASPGVEIEDSFPAARLGELGGHLLAAIALVMPGIGPIIADGPLSAELAESLGHLAGGIAKMLQRTGMTADEAERWEARISGGAILLGVHTDTASEARILATLEHNGATEVTTGTWSETNE